MTLQRQPTESSDAPKFSYSLILFLFLSLPVFTKKNIAKSRKYVYLLCNSKEERRTVNYRTKKNKRPPSAKRPRRPTEPSELLFRKNCPTPPTGVIFLLSQQRTSPQNIVLIDFYLNWLTGHNRQYMPTFGQIMGQLQAARISPSTAARGSAAKMPKNFERQQETPPHSSPHLFGPLSLRPNFLFQIHQPW